MINLPRLEDTELIGKRVMVRLDLDVEDDDFRLKSCLATIDFLMSNDAKLILIGHKGRPKGKMDAHLSLKSVTDKFRMVLQREVEFVHDTTGFLAKEKVRLLEPGRAILLENLRFDPREETNAEDFAKQLSLMGEFYVNEAFATSHRQHASIVGIPKSLPHAAGIHFGKEIDNLEKAFVEPARPVLVVVSGLKEDKLPYVEAFKSFADVILVGGRLPEYAEKAGIKGKDQKVVYADLLPDKEDITIHSIERFEAEVGKAKTIVVAGPLGKFEDPGHRMGTERVFKAIAASTAFKVVGGGDTHKAISLLKLEAGFNWLSVGGGASLEFLAKRTLPGLAALLN